MMILRIFAVLLCACIFGAQSTLALDSDQGQPATLEADDFELDLKTGVRTYRGNVVYRQGSIRLDCDELVTYFNDDGELDKAICNGDPGKFKQRPEGSDDDMLGQAREITFDQVDELVVMKSNANVKQGLNELAGRLITYDLSTEKVRVKGTKAKPTKTTTGSDTATASTSGSSEDKSSVSEQPATAEEETARPTLTIQPRKKKKKEPATEAATE